MDQTVLIVGGDAQTAAHLSALVTERAIPVKVVCVIDAEEIPRDAELMVIAPHYMPHVDERELRRALAPSEDYWLVHRGDRITRHGGGHSGMRARGQARGFSKHFRGA